MTFILKALRIGQNSRHHAAHRIGHRHGSDLAAGEHKVTQGDLLVHAFINEPLVNALIMAANQNQILHFAEPNGIGLAEGLSTG
jgi:hypothetical protein